MGIILYSLVGKPLKILSSCIKRSLFLRIYPLIITNHISPLLLHSLALSYIHIYTHLYIYIHTYTIYNIAKVSSEQINKQQHKEEEKEFLKLS